MAKADIKVLITITGKDCAYTGYRPAHLIADCLTTGVHEYIGTERVYKGQSAEGLITFISPEEYPNSLKEGDIIPFQEGSKEVGYAEVIEVFNDILRQKE